MNGIFSDLLKACADWFLYVFIDANANLNSSIMTKRANQITWLKRLDTLNPTYTYNDLVNIVHTGIVEKYGKTPAEVLMTIYNTATGINGVRSTILEQENAKASANLQNLLMQTTTSTGEKKNANFWDSLSSTLQQVQQIVTSIGFGNPADIKPTYPDWNNPHKPQTASMFSMESLMSFAPYLVGAGIIIFALRGRKN